MKYGGLSSTRGHVDVAWNVEKTASSAPVLALTWRDGAPDRPVAPPAHRGFGSELIERNLVYDLDAVTRLDFGADGLRCSIRLPLSGRAA